MIDGDETARRKVDKAVLLKKAIDWRYEREWRLIGERGLKNSNLELEEVIFGVRCDSAVKYAIIKALEGRQRPVRFYEMRERPTTFGLSRVNVEIGDLTSTTPDDPDPSLRISSQSTNRPSALRSPNRPY